MDRAHGCTIRISVVTRLQPQGRRFDPLRSVGNRGTERQSDIGLRRALVPVNRLNRYRYNFGTNEARVERAFWLLSDTE